MDKPAGSTYIFSDDKKGLATDQFQVAIQLYKASRQFLIVFQDVRQREFKIGEYYAGKYLPALSYKSHKMNKYPMKLKLKGSDIGDGLSGNIYQKSYQNFLFETGLLVDDIDRNTQKGMSKITRKYIKQCCPREAVGEFNRMIQFFIQRRDLSVYNYLGIFQDRIILFKFALPPQIWFIITSTSIIFAKSLG